MSNLSGKSPQELERLQKAAERHLFLNKAKENLIDFAKQMMPNPEHPDDYTSTIYQAAAHHILMAEAVEQVTRGECLRLAISIGPQHGKTRLVSVSNIANYMGRYPHRNILFATYNEHYARKIGGLVRDYMTSARYKAIFPAVALKKGSKAKDALETVQGGQVNFIGRGGSGTGLPADLIVIDDPLKNAEEANSATTIEAMHEWYTKVIYSRVRTTTALILIHTRWLEDDLIGRACDPEHPDRKRNRNGHVLKSDSSHEWTYINIPAVLMPGPMADALQVTLEPSKDALVIEQFGAGPLRALWPEQFSLRHLATARRGDKQGFSALYMGQPTPEEGDYFLADDVIEYDREELPANLRYYAASDHALTERKDRDYTVLGCVGIDQHDNIWVLPDVVMRRMATDKTIDEMIAQMKAHDPMVWWAEDDIIKKSIGPFLTKRMKEEGVYTVVQSKTPSKDKKARARSIQGRMQMHKVRFPKFAAFWPEAKKQLLKFPRATHDDFVDWLAHIGMGLAQELSAKRISITENKAARVGSIEWIKALSKQKQDKLNLAKATGGF